MFKIVERIYPDHKIVEINEIFVPGIGWRSPLISGLINDPKEDIIPTIEKGTDAYGRTIEKVALILEDKNGFRIRADFSIKELLKEKKP